MNTISKNKAVNRQYKRQSPQASGGQYSFKTS
nr:MAG TPA: hypothetical protein [Caudoviricetes sp.]